MFGTIELDRDGRHLVIGFEYRQDLVDEVRNLPGRRWDRGSKQWRVPVAHVELVVATFMKHGFEVSGAVASILAGTGGSVAPSTPATADTAPAATAMPSGAVAAKSPADGLTILELNTRVQDVMRGAFPEHLRVIGEVVDFDKNRERNHIFFTLVEKDPNGRRLLATVSATIFERTAKRVLPAIEAKGLTMRDGIEIMAVVRVDFYPPSGRFQVIVEDIEPEFTLGKLALSREQILAELRQLGIDRANLDLPWPVPALRIGVLASPVSDGWNDFHNELRAAEIGFEVTLYPIKVQGAELQPTLLAGLEWFARRAAEFDVVCIVRGGGSRTDLAWFDNRDVALAVARHPLKIVCGIGHDRDRSVLDEIALSQKTPTAVAAYLVDQLEATREALTQQTRRLREHASDAMSSAQRHLTVLGHRLSRSVHGRIVGERARLDAAARRVAASTKHTVRQATQRLQTIVTALGRTSEQRLQRERVRLDNFATRQRLLDPARVVQRGYAIVQTPEGRIVTRIGDLRAGARIDIGLRDGRVRATVDRLEPAPQPGAESTPPPPPSDTSDADS